MILLTGGQKGGPGKTTIAVNMAAWRTQQGRRVLLVDADPDSRSASYWAGLRLKAGTEPRVTCVNLYGETLRESIEQLGDYDDVILDVGGADSVELRAGLTFADRMVVPCIVSGFDLKTMVDVDKLVRMARGFNRRLRASLVLNSASTNPRDNEAAEAREALAALGHMELLEHKLCTRKAYRDCAKYGASVWDLADKKAQQEAEALAGALWQEGKA